MYTALRRREQIPPLFIFYECQKIIRTFDLELQFIYPFSKNKPRTAQSSINPCTSVAKHFPSAATYFLSSTSTYSASITPSSFFAPAPFAPGSGPAPGVGPAAPSGAPGPG
jgi:hypothetical protein